MKKSVGVFVLVLSVMLSSTQNPISLRSVDIADIALWDKVNEVYTRFFGNHKPVRCVVPTRELHYGCLIEAECVAGV